VDTQSVLPSGVHKPQGLCFLGVDGQCTLLYSLVGLILITVVSTVDDVHQHSLRFMCVYSMCVVLALSAPINGVLVSFGIAGFSVLHVVENAENYRIELTHAVMAALWVAVAFGVYLRQRNFKGDTGTS